ncbi:MAG TPA: hypothetical protein VER03_12790 [Bryobacteraceae bacterium]|nr:hypothetical protein [Bryobacteraceae bacterium]
MSRRFLLAALLLTLTTLASAADLAGTWKGAFTFNDQAVPLSLKLQGSDQLTGTIEGFASGITDVKDAKVEGENLTFWVMIEYEGSPLKLVFQGKINSGEIAFAFGTEDGSWGTNYVAKKA